MPRRSSISGARCTKRALRILKKVFKKAPGPDDSAHAGALTSAMADVAANLREAFDRQYGWQADEAAKQVESLVVAKFLMDHAFISTYCDRMPKKRLRNFLVILDTVFESALEKVESGVSMDEIRSRLRAYSSHLMGNPAPACWLLAAGACIGRELADNEADFPSFLPKFFVDIKNTYSKIIQTGG